MNFEITNYNNFFKLRGHLNRRNLHLFQAEFEHIFDNLDKLTISIEGLESIDREGVNALAKLHNESITRKHAGRLEEPTGKTPSPSLSPATA